MALWGYYRADDINHRHSADWPPNARRAVSCGYIQAGISTDSLGENLDRMAADQVEFLAGI
jgi:hypothetical protein